MMKKRMYDLREQQRVQLAEIQAQKETLRVNFKKRGNKGNNFYRKEQSSKKRRKR